MGDLHSWPAHSNGNLSDSTPASLLQPYPPNPDPCSIDAATWQHAEEAAQDVIQQVHPTVLSERRRREVVGFVQRVIRQFAGAEVCPFGSVPLKTYLPDGDIDLTAIGMGPNFEDNLPNEVKNVLDLEEKKNNSDSKFEVKDVQLIHAEVKLVKCLVQNIIVDISFNQIGGLYTLCFLEQVDQLIGKDHLFKRSIMLIKSWCYYESRILGAHHGLISTYALETLVLYIFHLFHKNLDAPLAVLYRFLDYYSKFDWENYGVSLCGPISLSSLPEIILEPPEIPTSELLIQEEFARQCMDRFQVPVRPNEIRAFVRKNLNIVDPLKISNNLGRSVSKGNFYRIRSAFVFGARKLGQILTVRSSSDMISADVSTFFRNTLERHGSGFRPDIQEEDPPLCTVSDAPTETLLEPSQPSTAVYHTPHMFFHPNDDDDDDDDDDNNNNNNSDDDDNSIGNNNNKNDENLNGFADLSGEMEANLRSLLYAQQCHEYSMASAYMMPLPGPGPGLIPIPGPIFRGKHPPGPYGIRRGGALYGVVPASHFAPGPSPYYVMNGPVLPPAGAPPPPPGAAYVGEESPKPRGTGTYFPMSNYRQQNYRDRDRVSPRGKNPGSRSNTGTGRSTDQSTPASCEESVPASDLQQPPAPVMPPVQLITLASHNNRWVPMQRTGGGPGGNTGGNAGGSNGGGLGRQVEFGSLGSVVLPPVVSPGTRPVLGPNQRRRNSQMYQLKDEGDFPPLSG